jgi:hypothetical protein
MIVRVNVSNPQETVMLVVNHWRPAGVVQDLGCKDRRRLTNGLHHH